VGDVGLDRAEVAAAVEDDGQRLGEWEASNLERDRSRRPRVEQSAGEELIGPVVVLVLHPWNRSLDGYPF